MDFLIEILFRRILVRVLGLYTRYFFFKALRINKNINYLSGDKKEEDFYSQDFLNALVGIVVFLILILTIFFVVP